MDDRTHHQDAVELLQQLGLKAYEARSFVTLTRLPAGTAKDIAELSEVPRTRVYDAIRALESKGLVEIQHTNPQVFRAVSIDEAAETLQRAYTSRTEALVETLATLESISPPGDDPTVEHEVWALTGATSIGNRTRGLIDDATDEVILIIGSDGVATDDLFERLRAATDRGVSVVVGSDDTLVDTICEALPEAAVFTLELPCMAPSPQEEDDTEITQLMLVDHRWILVSASGHRGDHAIVGQGLDNGIVTIARRLMAEVLADDGALGD